MFNNNFFNSSYIPSKIITAAAVLLLAAVPSSVFGSGKTESEPMAQPMETKDTMKAMVFIENAETAVFAGGCFWGVEGVFERLNGVLDVVSGYSGGEAETAFYSQVGRGNTGHAESVQIIFDPEHIDYETLLEVFFSVAHDPTQLNYQGPDIGTEYRSAVFYLDDEQKRMTEKYINGLEEKGVYNKPIVTELTPLDAFYPAEAYHQDFLRLNPNHPYIVYWDAPKIMQLEETFPDLITKK